MLLTIEKVIFLKTVSFFAGVPDRTLAQLAAVTTEVKIAAGERLFAKGDAGDSLYIIIQGQVRVHDGEDTLNHLYERDVFGEMAVLDPMPRVASVTAVHDTLLLRLEENALFELMDLHVEVTRAIIRGLSQYLRARIHDLNEARAQLKTVS